MRHQPLILVVDDDPDIRFLTETWLKSSQYQVICAENGQEAVEKAKQSVPDLILLDLTMPEMDGLEACRNIRADPSLPFIPIMIVTGRGGTPNIVAGLSDGADEYLTKPVTEDVLVARVQSLLRVKALQDTVKEQAGELSNLNRTLEERVQTQLAELERARRLRRFLSPQLAEMVVSAGEEFALASHRREVTVVFSDLRGYTAFSNSVPPAALMQVLSEFHSAMGELVFRFEGTLERFTGDGMMVFFNDPQPMPDHPQRAATMAVAMQQTMLETRALWEPRGYRLDMGIGIAIGEATLGMIGFDERVDYSAIGPVTNLAARLCAEAGGGEILLSREFADRISPTFRVEPAGERALKGFPRPMPVFRIQSAARAPHAVE